MVEILVRKALHADVFELLLSPEFYVVLEHERTLLSYS